MTTQEILENRKVSSFYISIGTALPLESLFESQIGVYDEDRKIEKLNVNKYKKHYFNATTLIRNIIDSVDYGLVGKILKDRSSPEIIVNTLISELELMSELYVDTEPVLFFPDYTKVLRQIELKERKNNTIIREKENMIALSLSELYKRNYEVPMWFLEKTHVIPRSFEVNLITTHISLDLLNAKSANLELLESNTGRLIKPHEFNKKFQNMNKNMVWDMLPFTERLLYLIGDSMIKPINIKDRRKLYNEVIKEKVTPFSSSSKIDNILKSLNLYDKKIKKMY